MTKRTIAFVFARGGSKGLPGKNLAEIDGTPLVGHSIKTALTIEEVDSVYVSTDCDEIGRVARAYGARVIKRPDSLATDTASEIDAWKHAIVLVQEEIGDFDVFLSLPATAPCRRKCDVERCLEELKDGVDMVLTMKASSRSPWFNMVRRGKDGHLSRIIEDKSVGRRQDTPKTYDLTTVAYVGRPHSILKSKRLWDATCVGVCLEEPFAIDIDTEYDLVCARYIYEHYGIRTLCT